MALRPKAGGVDPAPSNKPEGVWHPDLGTTFVPHFSADQHVGTALRETFRLFAQSVSRNVSGLGLTLNMWFVLRSLWETDGQSQADLAKRLEVTPAAMVGIVNSLEDAGLVARKPSKTDGRAYRIFLTTSGKSVRVKATAQALQVDAKALRGLSVSEVEVLLRLMQRLRENLSQ